MCRHEKPPIVIHINFYSAKVDNVYFPQVYIGNYSLPSQYSLCRFACLTFVHFLWIWLQLEVVGDIANAVWQLSESLSRQQHWEYGYMLQVQRKLVIMEKSTDWYSFLHIRIPVAISHKQGKWTVHNLHPTDKWFFYPPWCNNHIYAVRNNWDLCVTYTLQLFYSAAMLQWSWMWWWDLANYFSQNGF